MVERSFLFLTFQVPSHVCMSLCTYHTQSFGLLISFVKLVITTAGFLIVWSYNNRVMRMNFGAHEKVGHSTIHGILG